MIAETTSAGRTPAQTVSRVLQELRDEGKLFFSEAGVYVINGAAINAACEDFPDDVLDHAAQSGTLVLADVATSDAISQLRTRRGMAAVRRATLLNYRGRCRCAISPIYNYWWRATSLAGPTAPTRGANWRT